MSEPERFVLRDVPRGGLPKHLQEVGAMMGEVSGLARFGLAAAGDLCFCDRLPGTEYVRADDLSTVLCPPDLTGELAEFLPRARLVPIDDPRAVFIDLAHWLLACDFVAPTSRVPEPFGIASSAVIGANTHVDPEARIDDDVKVGANCVIHRGVWLQRGTVVRDGAVIGTTGINAYRGKDGRIRDFPHLAGVIVGEDVEIGANAVVVTGVLTSTAVGPRCVIGNLCNIGHGADIGEAVWMSVGCTIGGHARLGDKATLGMAVAVRDNLTIGAGAQVGMGSVVVKDVGQRGSVFGNPARPVPPISAGPER